MRNWSSQIEDSRIDLLLDKVHDRYQTGDPGHDMAHIKRVVDCAIQIGKLENADLKVLIPAALLHDVINLPKNHPEREHASQMAAKEASVILADAHYSLEEISKISIVITEHSFSKGLKPSCLESAILQDCDRLDAIGAIGIMRTVSCGVRLGAAYYDIEEPFAHKRELDDKRFTIDHFSVKLLKLIDGFHTQAAKAEAQHRHEFMKTFLAQLKKEIRAL